MPEFIEGSIVRIKLENFLTYDAVEFRPGAHLNVIIGPNGTGKSSIVCAICLGLCGKTAVLGRQKEIGEFIKHGQQRAYVEIELFNPDGENYVVGRMLIREGNTSKWSVNKRSSSQKAVEELVKKLNIQVNNLCQFLPQDKVQEFAKMSPQELLENTQKAVDTDDLAALHDQLKSSCENGRDLERVVARTKETLEREVVQNARLDQDVKNYKDRKQHLEKIGALKMKRPWAEYEEKRVQYKQNKDRVDELKEDVRHARQQNAPLKSKMDAAAKQRKKIEELLKQKTEESRDDARQAAKRSTDIDKQTDEIIELDHELDQARINEQRRATKIRELSSQLETLESELAEVKDTDVQPQLEENQKKLRAVSQEMSQIQHQDDNISQDIRNLRTSINGLQSELSRVQDVKNRRLEMLRRISKDTYSAVLWLRDNKHLFKGTVHEPIMTLINVKKDQFTKYIESHVSMHDLRAFVCEDPDDLLLFLQEVCDKQSLAVNAIAMPDQAVDSFRPQHPISYYAQYGFYSYLREMIDCPEQVMRYLCRQWRFHAIPVGNEYTKQNVERVTQNCPELNSFYTENHQYYIKRSRYGGDISSRVSEIRAPSLLTVSYDNKRERQIRDELEHKQAEMHSKETEHRDLQHRQKELERQLAQLREEKKHLQEKKGQRRQLMNRIDMKKQSIQRYQSEAVDLTKEEDRINTKIKRICSKKCKLLQELSEYTERCHKASIQKVRLSIQQAKIHSSIMNMEAELREQSVALSNLEREFEQLKDDLKKTKEQARRLLEIAKGATDTRETEELSAELKSSFEALPSTLTEIDALIHQEQARADCNFQTDENVIVEFEDRQKLIAELTVKLADYETRVHNHKENMEDVKKRWEEPLRNLIARINDKFAYFFSCLKCAGEVDLAVPNNPEDYAAYGISIKVKFRAEAKLTELKASYQSGGEKSVATVLYMMALQELTICPFRCVDEINQGMDAHNERKVFELMVETACRENTSQYFLLTPKLLPDLQYSHKMTVLCVFNGPYMVDWNLKKFIKRRQKLLAADYMQ